MPSKKSRKKAIPPGRSEPAQRLLQLQRAHPFVSAGQRVGVAVSGGADSVALLLLFLEVRERLGIVLSVVHFNHKLRGKASDADEKFVARLAAQHNLEFFVGREDVAARSRRERRNLEEAARRARYAFFDGLVAEGRMNRIAVAHTADDQAETVLAHILRGAGLAGLAGIHPEAGVVFRPLLKIRRAELRSYLRARGQKWREDASNRDTKRMRARIRHKLLPLLEKQFQPVVVEHLCQLAELAREDDGQLNFAAKMRVEETAKEESCGVRIKIEHLLGHGQPLGESEAGKKQIPRAGTALGMTWSEFEQPGGKLQQGHHALASRMIRQIVKKVKPRSGQLSAVHVEAVLHLAEQADSGKSLQLPGGVEVRRERDTLLFRASLAEAHATRSSAPRPYSYALELTGQQAELQVVEHSYALRFTVIDWPPEGRETREIGAVLDRDRLCVPLVVRNWRPGDAVQPFGYQKGHKLSRLLNEVGVSRWEKESWPVLTSGGKIAWTRGLPVASEFAAGEATRAGVVITEVPLTQP